jgi:hypothetical protein
MAIKYLDAKRIRGNTGASGSDGWSINTAQQTIGSGVLDWKADSDSSSSIDGRAVYDLGVGNEIDGDFVIRFKGTFDAKSSPTPGRFFFWVSNADNAKAINGEDALVMDFHDDLQIRALATNSAQGFTGASGSKVGSFSTGNTYYFEFKRNGTALTGQVFTASDFSTGASSVTTTTLASAFQSEDYRYVGFKSTGGGWDWTPEDAYQDWTFDDIVIYDNQTSATTATTTLNFNDVPDDKATLITALTSKTDNMTTDLGWTANSTPSGQGYDATNDRVIFKGINTSSDETESPRISMDMQDADWFGSGVNMSDTNFVAKFELRLTTYNASSSGENRNYFGFFSHNVWGGTASDRFVLELTADGGGSKYWRVVVGDDELHEGTSGTYKSDHFATDAAIDTTYYITFTKTGGNAHAIRITTSSDYTGGEELSITRSNVTNLRYFAVKGRGDTQGAANGDTTGYIDNLNISNGSITFPETDLPENTLFEETDTQSTWWLQSSKWKGANQPLEISDLWAWWKAESQYMTLNSSGVTVWNPQTNTTPKKLISDSAGVEPTFEANGRNGRGIVKFDGTEVMHTNDDSYRLTQPLTFVIVMKFPTAVDDKTIFDADNTGNRLLHRNTGTAGTQLELNNGATFTSTATTQFSASWGYEVLVFNGGSSKWRINGVDVKPGTFNPSDDFNPITIASDYRALNGGSNNAVMDVMHFIIYDKALSDSEITDIEEWCASEVGT